MERGLAIETSRKMRLECYYIEHPMFRDIRADIDNQEIQGRLPIMKGQHTYNNLILDEKEIPERSQVYIRESNGTATSDTVEIVLLYIQNEFFNG